MNSTQSICGIAQLGGYWAAIRFDPAPKQKPDYTVTFISNAYESKEKAFAKAKKHADEKIMGLACETFTLDGPLVMITKEINLWVVTEIHSKDIVSHRFRKTGSALNFAKKIPNNNNGLFYGRYQEPNSL